VTQYTYDGPAAAVIGSDSYLVFTPDGYSGRTRVPLVVVAHGSNGTAAEMLDGFGLDKLAENYDFIVMYPDDDDDLHPGPLAWGQSVGAVWQPDVALIAGMTRATMAQYRINRQRVYAMGFSAGAIVMSDLGATYPDLYAAIGIMSGAPFNGFVACATGEDPAVGGIDSEVALESREALLAEASHRRVMPAFVFNGDADTTVNPLCDELAVRQWLMTDNLVIDGQGSVPLSATPARHVAGRVPGGRAYDVYDYTQPSGCLIAQHWIVHGMGHSLSGTELTDPKGPSEAAAAWAFVSHYTLSSTSRPCAQVRGSNPSVKPQPAAAMTGSAGVARETTHPDNTLTRYRNEVSIAYSPTSRACVSQVQNTGACRAYSSIALRAAGARPGGEVTVGGFTFQWPNTSSGQPDSVSPARQSIAVRAPLGTNVVAILGATAARLTTAYEATVVELHYAGRHARVGSMEAVFPDWDGLIAGAVNDGSLTPEPGELRSDFQVLNSTVPVADPASVYAVTVPVDPTRRLVSVTFADTDPSIRMFDLQPATVREATTNRLSP
jgi:poly(3-hydroxybutyrate) depolymerase